MGQKLGEFIPDVVDSVCWHKGVFQELGEPVFLLDENPTAENIAKLIFDYAAGQGFPVVEVRLWETPRCFASYRPDQEANR